MKRKLLPLMLLAGGSLFAETHFSVGIGVGAPAYYPPPAMAAVRPPCPGPDYTWVDGYRGSSGAWVAGYWAPPAYYAAPRYRRDWDDRDHDRYRDHDRDRDHDRGHDRDRGFSNGFRR